MLIHKYFDLTLLSNNFFVDEPLRRELRSNMYILTISSVHFEHLEVNLQKLDDFINFSSFNP